MAFNVNHLNYNFRKTQKPNSVLTFVCKYYKRAQNELDLFKNFIINVGTNWNLFSGRVFYFWFMIYGKYNMEKHRCIAAKCIVQKSETLVF